MDEYFSSDLSPPPSLPSFGSSPYGYRNSLRFRGFSCFLRVLVLLGFVSLYLSSSHRFPPPLQNTVFPRTIAVPRLIAPFDGNTHSGKSGG